MFGITGDTSASGTACLTIHQSVDEVFRYIAVDFFDNYPRWSPEVQLLEPISEPPLKLGSIVRQMRIDQGQRSDSKFKVTHFEVNKHLSFEGITENYRCSYTFATAGNSTNDTDLTFTFELTKLELFMLPFEKLIRVAVKDGAARTVRNIKNLIEQETTTRRNP